MNGQQKIIHDFLLVEGKSESIAEMKVYPSTEKFQYTYEWVKNVGGEDCNCLLQQMGNVIYLNGEIAKFTGNDELTIFRLLNELNGISHYGSFAVFGEQEKKVIVEQSHFCDGHIYSEQMIAEFTWSLYGRLFEYLHSANSVFEMNIPVLEAVDRAREISKIIRSDGTAAFTWQ
jgi:hypothetical protein